MFLTSPQCCYRSSNLNFSKGGTVHCTMYACWWSSLKDLQSAIKNFIRKMKTTQKTEYVLLHPTPTPPVRRVGVMLNASKCSLVTTPTFETQVVQHRANFNPQRSFLAATKTFRLPTLLIEVKCLPRNLVFLR
jgi:hypothetical protein